MRASDYGLEARYDGIQAEARAVVESLAPRDREPAAGEGLTATQVKAFRTSGLSRHAVPGRFGGVAEKVDPVAVCLIREELMYGSSPLDAMFALQGIGSYALTLAGDPEVRGYWLPRIASGKALAAMALTEPGAGSDLKAATTTIRTDGDELVINGLKSFISHAEVADVITVFGKEEGGWSLVSVPAGTPGMTVRPGPSLIAPHDVADVVLDGVRVPVSHRIGAPGKAFELVLATLTVFRASVAGSAVGLAQAALDEAVRHCRDREQFGRPLYKLGPVAGLLADSGADVEMSRLLAYRAATRARDLASSGRQSDGRQSDGSQSDGRQSDAPASAAERAAESLDYSSMAKLAATEATCRVVDRCVQAMGRFGLVADSRIGQIYLLQRPLRIYEGASEVLRLGVARYLTAQLPE